MKKKTIVILGILVIALVVFYLFLNRKNIIINKNANEKPEIALTIKTPVLQMTAYKDEEIKDTYTFMKKLATAFESQYKDANVKISINIWTIIPGFP